MSVDAELKEQLNNTREGVVMISSGRLFHVELHVFMVSMNKTTLWVVVWGGIKQDVMHTT